VHEVGRQGADGTADVTHGPAAAKRLAGGEPRHAHLVDAGEVVRLRLQHGDAVTDNFASGGYNEVAQRHLCACPGAELIDHMENAHAYSLTPTIEEVA
jgi:transcriptional regulator of nitric oxide reductase